MFRLNAFAWGLGIWLVATIALRFIGQFVLRPNNPLLVIALFLGGFAIMAAFTRMICLRLAIPRDDWPAAAVCLALPTLLLDPFSSAFFRSVFPNINADAAGIFGGWMLCCCAGALVAVLRRSASLAV